MDCCNIWHVYIFCTVRVGGGGTTGMFYAIFKAHFCTTISETLLRVFIICTLSTLKVVCSLLFLLANFVLPNLDSLLTVIQVWVPC